MEGPEVSVQEREGAEGWADGEAGKWAELIGGGGGDGFGWMTKLMGGQLR